MNDCVFCPVCNHAVVRFAAEAMRFPWGMRCGNCDGAPIAMFYSIGSRRHELQVEERKARHQGFRTIPPPPLPDKVAA